MTFSDAISVVRRQLWLEGVFESHGQTRCLRTSRGLAGGDPGGLGAVGRAAKRIGAVPRKRPVKGQKSSSEARRDPSRSVNVLLQLLAGLLDDLRALVGHLGVAEVERLDGPGDDPGDECAG